MNNWLKEWAGVLTLFVAFITLIVMSILTVSIFYLEKKFREKQKQRKDVETIMDWATRILALQNEYFTSEDLFEINKKSNELEREHFQISFLAGGLNKSIYDKAECLNKEFARFRRQITSKLLESGMKPKEVPYSREIQSAVQDLLQEAIKFRSKL